MTSEKLYLKAKAIHDRYFDEQRYDPYNQFKAYRYIKFVSRFATICINLDQQKPKLP